MLVKMNDEFVWIFKNNEGKYVDINNNILLPKDFIKVTKKEVRNLAKVDKRVKIAFDFLKENVNTHKEQGEGYQVNIKYHCRFPEKVYEEVSEEDMNFEIENSVNAYITGLNEKFNQYEKTLFKTCERSGRSGGWLEIVTDGYIFDYVDYYTDFEDLSLSEKELILYEYFEISEIIRYIKTLKMQFVDEISNLDFWENFLG